MGGVLTALERWLWGNSFAEPFPRAEVWAGLRDEVDGSSLLVAAEKLAVEAGRLSDVLQQTRQRSGAPADEEELRRFAKALLPTLDGLDRLVEFAEEAGEKRPELKTWAESIEAVRTKLLRNLERIGLAPIACLGATVDLNVHEVVRTVKSPHHPPEIVIEEQQRGYYFRGKLLRDARVVVTT